MVIPVGYPDGPHKKTTRRKLSEIVHRDHYDEKKHMTNRQIVEYVRSMREKTMSKYIKADEVEKRKKP